MTREQFLQQLRSGLGRMGEGERREILADYEEHFRMGAADGKTEEAIAESLGNPRHIGKSYAIDAILEPKDGVPPGAATVLRAVFASISLTFFNLVVVLGPFLGIVGVLIGLWATALSLAVSGIAVALAPLGALVAPRLFDLGGLNPVALVFAGIGLAGLGVLAGMGMLKLTQLFGRGTAEYVKLNARIVTRRR
jgi:uncharacterized membrane protein